MNLRSPARTARHEKIRFLPSSERTNAIHFIYKKKHSWGAKFEMPQKNIKNLVAYIKKRIRPPSRHVNWPLKLRHVERVTKRGPRNFTQLDAVGQIRGRFFFFGGAPLGFLIVFTWVKSENRCVVTSGVKRLHQWEAPYTKRSSAIGH